MNIIYTLIVLYLPVALSNLIGEDACNFVDLIGTTYILSQVVWSSFIAIYRVILIKFHGLLKNGIKKPMFVFILSAAGHIFIFASAVLFAYYDKGIQYRLCAHRSVEELEILQVIKVSPNKALVSKVSELTECEHPYFPELQISCVGSNVHDCNSYCLLYFDFD